MSGDTAAARTTLSSTLGAPKETQANRTMTAELGACGAVQIGFDRAAVLGPEDPDFVRNADHTRGAKRRTGAQAVQTLPSLRRRAARYICSAWQTVLHQTHLSVSRLVHTRSHVYVQMHMHTTPFEPAASPTSRPAYQYAHPNSCSLLAAFTPGPTGSFSQVRAPQSGIGMPDRHSFLSLGRVDLMWFQGP